MARNTLQGTLDLLVLKSLAQAGVLHGMDFISHIRRRSGDRLHVPQGSLYPALHRMEQQGWIVSQTGHTPLGWPSRLYRLTPDGRRQLAVLRHNWLYTTEGVNTLLRRP